MKQEGVQYDVQGHKNAFEESVEWGHAQPEPFVKSLIGLLSRPTRLTTSATTYPTICYGWVVERPEYGGNGSSRIPVKSIRLFYNSILPMDPVPECT